MNLVRSHPVRVFLCAVFVLYGLAVCAVHLVPESSVPAWLSMRYLHPTAAWLLLIAAVTLWIPAKGPRQGRWLGGLAAGAGLLLLPLLLPALLPDAILDAPAYRLLWPADASGWPCALIGAWLVAFLLLAWRPSRFSYVLSATIAYLLIAGAALGVAGNFLKLDLIYNQPLLAPIPLPLAVVLFVFSLLLLRRRKLAMEATQVDASREDSLISSIGLGLLLTIAFSTGLISFIKLQSQVESSLYQSQLLTMDNRIIIFYHAMDDTYSELSALPRDPEVIRLLSELGNKPSDALREQLAAYTNERLPLSVTAFEYRSDVGVSVLRHGEFLPSRTLWTDYRGTTEIRLNWREGMPFLTLVYRVNGRQQEKIGEVTIEQRVLDWEQLVTDSYDLGRTGAMIICGLQNGVTSCLDSRHSLALVTPKDDDPLMPLILDSFEGERSAGDSLQITYDAQRKPMILTYGSIGRVRLATKAAGIYLGMLISVDAEEFYEPVRKQLREVLPLLLGIIVAGAIVLRRLVLPLIRALRDKEARFRELTELSSDCYWQMDSQLHFVEITGMELQQSGIRVQEWLGRGIRWVPASFENDGIVDELEGKLARHEFFYDVTLRLQGEEAGDTHFVSLSGAPLYNEAGDFIGYRGVGKDVTLRMLAEEALRESQQSLELRVAQRTAELSVEVQERTQAEARFRSLAELSSDWYWEVDTGGRFTQLSGEVDRKGGFSATASLGRAFWEQPWAVAGENDWESLRILLASREPFHDYILKIHDFDDQLRYLAISGQPIFDQQNTFIGYRGTGKDVTEKRLSEERIHFLAHYDPLTKLPNRTLLYEQLRGAIERAKRYGDKLALLFIDLDRFKIINDSLGHDAGDEVLCTVSQRLKDCVRDCDMVARLGGDEFVILLEKLGEANHASVTARRALDLINLPILLMGEPYTVGASIGISLYPDDGGTIAELLRHSDAAMYRAKADGRNGIFFFSNVLNDESVSALRVENDLRLALEQEQFLLHFQPKLDLEHNRIVGVEALIRWQHPARGMVPPLEFIPVAEESGLIVGIGEWVLDRALGQLQAWDAAGLPQLTMAVNLSPRQLQPDLPDKLAKALARHGLPAERLVLELTESLMLQRPERDILLLQSIQQMGVHIALDDFGTGFSSLSSLASLPIDCVKMDKSFVDELPADLTLAAISRSIITLARGVGLEVVAEGVETQEQWAWLAAEGCHQIQGYCFSKPLPTEALQQFVADFTHRNAMVEALGLPRK